jgi:hypothetical protein
VEPEFFLFGCAVLACWEDCTDGSALDVGVGVWIGSPEFDGVVDAHVEVAGSGGVGADRSIASRASVLGVASWS